MVNAIVNKIVQDLTLSLPFVDKITGIVKVASIQVGDAVKTLPISYNSNVSTCSQSELMDYVPDNGQMSIIYFEDRGTQVTRMENQSIYFTSNFTLVCWFDYRKIDCSIIDPALVAANILKYLPENMGNIYPAIGVFLSVAGQQANDGGVFSKYSYMEVVSQFITYPYGYVAIDLQAEYKVRKECITDLEPCTPIC